MAKFDEKHKTIILDAIGNGLSQRDAAKMAGIDETTLSRWKKKNVKFAEQMAQKEIEFKQVNINIIQNAGLEGTWQASAWILERKFSDEFKLRKEEVVKDERGDEHLEELRKIRKGVVDKFNKISNGKTKSRKTNKRVSKRNKTNSKKNS